MGTKNKTISSLSKEIQKIEKSLQVECDKCDGTGKPRTKTGEPPKKGKGNIECKNCKGTGIVCSQIELIKNKIEKMRKNINKLEVSYNVFLKRQTAEIRVLPEGKDPKIVGDWEDYTGVFYVDVKDEKGMVLKKAQKHYESYFQDGVYHRNKTLGIFINNSTGKHLIEKFKTGE